MAKDFLTSKGIPFEDFNVATDLEKRKEMMDKSGQMGVPVILIEDQLIVGFDREKIVQLLDIKE
jgi:glutaredoxin